MVLSLRRKIHIDSLARPPAHKVSKKYDTEALANSLGSPSSIKSVKDKKSPYRISARLQDLAKPIERSTDMFYNANPYSISQHVLKYKATPRIIELAQPKDREMWEYRGIKYPDSYAYQRAFRANLRAKSVPYWRYRHYDDV